MSVLSRKYRRALDFRGQCVTAEDNFFLIMMKCLFLPSLYFSKQSEEFLFFFSLKVLNCHAELPALIVGQIGEPTKCSELNFLNMWSRSSIFIAKPYCFFK